MSHLHLDKAKAFAFSAHEGQRYGDKPYSVHLEDVVHLLGPFGLNAQIIGYLHDVVEDTDVTLDQLQDEFGVFVAQCVDILTDKPGSNRAQRKRQTYALMARVVGDHELALVVKAADRLANVSACVKSSNLKKFTMYRDEHEQFKSAAYRQDLCESLWNELDQLIGRAL
ncbi:MAG: HD domain-containing protein [Pseudomonadales bacterium]|nr:HD domain-containing protein [Pseudomonadales bacterium]